MQAPGQGIVIGENPGTIPTGHRVRHIAGVTSFSPKYDRPMTLSRTPEVGSVPCAADGGSSGAEMPPSAVADT
jgi:hypothetical protein